MLILDKVWGGIFPSEDYIHNDLEYFSLIREVGKFETALSEQLSDEQIKTLGLLLEKRSEADYLANRDAFAYGMRVGAMIMMDVFCE